MLGSEDACFRVSWPSHWPFGSDEARSDAGPCTSDAFAVNCCCHRLGSKFFGCRLSFSLLFHSPSNIDHCVKKFYILSCVNKSLLADDALTRSGGQDCPSKITCPSGLQFVVGAVLLMM